MASAASPASSPASDPAPNAAAAPAPGGQHALACLLGAAVGDAVGATLEFQGKPQEVEAVRAILSCGGGGCHMTKHGQITDDTELALCIARGLIRGNSTAPPEHVLDTFNADAIAQFYVIWNKVEPRPFDCGITTGSAITGASRLGVPPIDSLALDPLPLNAEQPYALALTRAARYQSMTSKANGSVMRCTPFALWGQRLFQSGQSGIDALAACAWRDSSLTHPNASCCAAEASYVLCAASLIASAGDPAKSLRQRAEEAFGVSLSWVDRALAAATAAGATLPRDGLAEVRSWLLLAQQNHVEPYHPQAGFVKIGYIHAFRHVLLLTPFVAALHETILGGGDTDTNAAIVCGLVGALHGLQEPIVATAAAADAEDADAQVASFRALLKGNATPPNAIPLFLAKKVLACTPPDTESPHSHGGSLVGRPRGAFLHSRHIPDLCERLLAGGPARLTNVPPLD